MKIKLVLLSCALFISLGLFAQHDHKKAEQPADTVKKSIPKEVHAQIGDNHMMIHYYAPAVRGRNIWGGLVPFGEVWVTGAHSATSFEFNKDITINNVRVPAGKYALFTIPGKDKWIVIINKNWNQHLADDYDPKEDVVRVEVKPTPSKHQERLLYRIEPVGKNGELQILWEKIRIVVPFTLTK